MPEFLELLPPTRALSYWLNFIPQSLKETERLAVVDALGRVAARPIFSPEPLPAFPRSSVDGYAVRAADTFGASESLPAYLMVKGELPMGTTPPFDLQPGEAALIHTGGMLPKGSDAVVMLEYTQPSRENEIEVLRAVAEGENVLKPGEDVKQGEEVVAASVRLRPPEIGGLMGLGILELDVLRRPRVGVLSTGDEVVPPEAAVQPGQVRDINSYSLSALVEQAGGIAQRYGIFPDQAAALEAGLRKALDECDAVLITAGSSASTRDLTAEVINRMGKPGVLVHGLNIRPGKPTILAVCDGKPVVGLPGNPVSALVIAYLFVQPVLNRLCGVPGLIHPAIRAKLTVNLPSQAGREDYYPAKLVQKNNAWQADPIFYKSNLIFSLSRADGLIHIPEDATGLGAGEEADVYLLGRG
ncbi:MAG: molybdopterin molybdenumtransferase MoeA [Bellilinea sp.]|nr:MAG: molybdopterin molybdenumtransferase MoeA [Bellilinea sp.]